MTKFRKITYLDTSVGTNNLGDEIIVDAVRREVDPLIEDALVFRVGTHDPMGPASRGIVKGSEAAIMCGTNGLSSRMWFRATWKLRPIDALTLSNIVLCGVGWYQYMRVTDPYSRWLLKSVLSKSHLHATRDSYSRDKLKGMGVENVVNTGCPTLWQFSPAFCADLPRSKAREVVTTVNTWFRNPALDRAMLDALKQNYDKTYIWVQTDSDREYAAGLGYDITFLDPSLAAYDHLLESHDSLDYVGNRLHGGIRAMQKGRRAAIIEVDNRAREMGRDFGLPTLKRDDLTTLQAMIEGERETRVNLPTDEIERWKAQFRA